MKIYLAEYGYDQASFEEIIENNFHNFNIYRYESYSLGEEFSWYLYKSFDKAYYYRDFYRDFYSTIIIVEYNLSEEGLFNMFLDKEIKSKPTNVWFYNFDKDIKDFKLIKNIN